MRVWDISPGYLNRGSLLGEHAEVHAVISVIVKGGKGYSRHPEVVRWTGYGWALGQRHRLLASEMKLRGIVDKSPVLLRDNSGRWPDTYIDAPRRQFEILEAKYIDKERGRIPLPKNAQELWSHHKYSVLARDVSLYKKFGSEAAGLRPGDDFSSMAMELAEALRTPPSEGGIRNALEHMWGHVSACPSSAGGEVASWPSARLLEEIQARAMTVEEPYLVRSTALSELAAWFPGA